MTIHADAPSSYTAASATFGFTFPVMAGGVLVSEIDGTAYLAPNFNDSDDFEIASISVSGLAKGPCGSVSRCEAHLPETNAFHAPIVAWLTATHTGSLRDAWHDAIRPRRAA